MRKIYFIFSLLLFCNFTFAQTPIFSENIGVPTGTTTLSTYSNGTAPATFQNKGTLTYSNGGVTNSADIRITSVSSTYTGFSAGGNVFFTSIAGSYGFSIESINALSYNTLVLQFGYRKESATLLADFSVEYWDGTSWAVVANTSTALFNEAANATAGWYLSKALSLPASAQINGLKIRFVKSGTVSIRIDDIKFTGTASTVSSNADLTNLTLSAGTLTPVFAAATISYTALVANATTSITVTPTKSNVHTDIKVNGTIVPSGTASESISLNVGSNIITTVVTAEDGTTTKTYTVDVTRAAPVVTVSASVAAGIHAAEPATSGTFTVNLTAPAPAGGTAISYTLTGTATLGTDYNDPFLGSITIAAGTSSGTVTLNVIDDTNVEGTETIVLTLNAATNGVVIGSPNNATINLLDNDFPKVVINEVYGGGGNNGATYKNDFIELYNNENFAVNLSGWTVQYASSAGTTWQTTTLSGTIPAKGYYLIQQAAGAGGTTNLPTPDATGSIALSGTAGKVALVSNTTALSGACPTSSAIIDLVGYGSTANCSETAPTAAPSNTTSASRTPKGTDTNNNSADFTVGVPTPFNSVTDVTAPVITTLTPANNATGVSPSSTATVVFSENVVKGTGNIVIKRFSDNVTVQTLDVTTTSVSVSGINLSFDLSGLAFNTIYYVEMPAGVVNDPSDNDFAGITGNSTWKFTTGAQPFGALDVTYDFNTCVGTFPNGFTQFSVTGVQKWGCTAFGRDPSDPTLSLANGVQMNGFASGANNLNEDWFISPAYNLVGTTYPLLSYWTRTAFTGEQLKLMVSTNYAGTGNPGVATWVELNGKFPSTASDIWTLSNNINLSAYKGAAVYVAIVYNSTSDDGARWTLDDFTIANSLTPPPPSLTVSAVDMLFPYTGSGFTKTETVKVTGNDLVESMTLTATGVFQLSKDGISFSPILTYTVAEANDITQTVHVRFAPNQNNQNFTGTITASTSSITSIINLAGTSIDPATTLEVVNWNIEWFGSTTLGPTNDPQQEANVLRILQSLNADVYGLTEIVSEARLADVVSKMDGYAYAISNFGSHTNTSANPPSPLAEAQKLAFVYKTSVINNKGTRAMLSIGINSNEDRLSASYNDWSSGRYPFLMDADVTLNCETRNVKFVLVHAKANTAPVATSYDRRQRGANTLRDTLENIQFADKNIIIFGDFNDDLDVSITTGKTTTSWDAFTTSANYFPLTLPLSLAGKKSTVSYKDMIDHVVVSDEMNVNYMSNSARSLTDVSSLVTNYGSTTSDHYPIFTRFTQPNTVAPSVTSCTATVTSCQTGSNEYTIPAFIATDDCNDPITYSFEITGATTRSGSSNDASGTFNTGTSTINWTATDNWGNTATCQTTVVVNANPSVTIPDAFALPNGTLPNTVYIGYAPASTITLSSTVSGGTPAYSYVWSSGSTNSTTTVSPTTITTYTLTVTDANNCQATATKTIDVVDIRGGNKMDKVTICHNQNSLVVSASAVAAHLNHGDMLGGCPLITAQRISSEKVSEETAISKLTVKVLSNPTSSYFSLIINSDNKEERISMKVTDILGRVVEQNISFTPYQIKTIGMGYKTGVYFIEISQGKERFTSKLIKQ